MKYTVIITHELGFFSDYEIEAEHHSEAEKEAKRRFYDDFCGSNRKYSLTAFTIDKHNKDYKAHLERKEREIMRNGSEGVD